MVAAERQLGGQALTTGAVPTTGAVSHRVARCRRRAVPLSGLTLVELLIGLAMTSIMLGALTSLVTVTLGTWRRSIAAAEAADEALAALDQITRDIRVAGYDPRQQGLPGLVKATTRRIAMAADLDADGRVDSRSKELIAYRRSRRGDLVRVVGRQAMPLLSGLAVDGLEFTYRDDQARRVDPRRHGAQNKISLVGVTLATRAALDGSQDRAATRVTGGARILSRQP